MVFTTLFFIRDNKLMILFFDSFSRSVVLDSNISLIKTSTSTPASTFWKRMLDFGEERPFRASLHCKA